MIVPNIEYTGKLKCFLGVILKSKNGIDYFTPLTSYKPKFNKLSNDIDFYKIIEKMENQLQAARRVYNIDVTEYNTNVLSFPNNVIAKILNLIRLCYLKLIITKEKIYKLV